ncbi:MAG: Asp-tRNA(Asn)/Glu-tRNA(Gln) amidotransferase subunit GatC [Chitinophagales bacterium]
MEVNDAMIEYLSELACLEFNAEEKEGIKKDLQRMISFIEKLKELDSSGIEPLLHMGEEMNVLRKDEIRGSITQEEALRNAPSSDGKYFRVPKVIKQPTE